MQDPRDKRFYELQKKHRSQLSWMEKGELISCGDRMIDYVRNKKSRGAWVTMKKELKADQ